MLIAWGQKLFRQMQKPRKWSDWSVSVTVSDSATWPFKSQFVHEFFQYTKASSSLSGSSGAPCKNILSDSRFQVWSRKRAIQQAAYRDSYAAMRRSAFWAETGFGKKRLMAAIRCFASGSWIWGNMTCRKDPGRSEVTALPPRHTLWGLLIVWGCRSLWSLRRFWLLFLLRENNILLYIKPSHVYLSKEKVLILSLPEMCRCLEEAALPRYSKLSNILQAVSVIWAPRPSHDFRLGLLAVSKIFVRIF